MERAHVLIRLRGEEDTECGVCRTSATTVRLEHSEMSPGVASITFEQVYDQNHTNEDVFNTTSVCDGVHRVVVEGQAMTFVATGASHSGKSYTLHGASEHHDPGVIEQSINRVFKTLEECKEIARSQVLLCCLHTSGDFLIDLLSGTTITEKDFLQEEEGVDAWLLSHARVVCSRLEALQLYRSALARKPTDSDLVCTLFVEYQRLPHPTNSHNVIYRGRLVFIDVHGSAIIEPSNVDNQEMTLRPSTLLFADTHFPVHQTLSHYFGHFIGHCSATYLLVTIHKAAKYQQHAIQSLLYACKAKDIKNECNTSSSVKAFTSSSTSRNLSIHNEPEQLNIRPSSPTTSTSSDSSQSSSSTQHNRGRNKNAVLTTHAIVTQRLRKAYQSAKRASVSHRPQMPSPVTEPEEEQAVDNTKTHVLLVTDKVDQILAAINKNDDKSKEGLSLLTKLDSVYTQYKDLERSMLHEASVKAKCVERISKLNQTMSFQAMEHEQELQQVNKTKCELEARLEEMQNKYIQAEEQLRGLYTEVEKLKVQQTSHLSPIKNGESNSFYGISIGNSTVERQVLQQFAVRLETAMQEAKGVVELKDKTIQALETKIQQLEAEYTAPSVWKEQVSRLENERTRLEQDLVQIRTQLTSTQTQLMNAENQHQTVRSSLEHQFAMVQEELSTSQKQHKDEVQRLSEIHMVELSKLREEFQREEAAAEAASMQQYTALQVENELLQQQLMDLTSEREQLQMLNAKEKRKYDKKIRILLNERKEMQDTMETQESVSQQQQAEMEHVQGQLQQVLEHQATTIAENIRLKQTTQEKEDLVQSLLAQDKIHVEQISILQQELETRTYTLEQSYARQMVEKEMRWKTEEEQRIQEMMTRHSHTIVERDMEIRSLQEALEIVQTQHQSTSSGSPTKSSSTPQQHSLDQLDAMLRQAKIPKAQRQKTQVCDTNESLHQQLDQLTQALALANEEETLTKQAMAQQSKALEDHKHEHEILLSTVNSLKHENWMLSLALQVQDRKKQS